MLQLRRRKERKRKEGRGGGLVILGMDMSEDDAGISFPGTKEVADGRRASQEACQLGYKGRKGRAGEDHKNRAPERSRKAAGEPRIERHHYEGMRVRCVITLSTLLLPVAAVNSQKSHLQVLGLAIAASCLDFAMHRLQSSREMPWTRGLDTH